MNKNSNDIKLLGLYEEQFIFDNWRIKSQLDAT